MNNNDKFGSDVKICNDCLVKNNKVIYIKKCNNIMFCYECLKVNNNIIFE